MFHILNKTYLNYREAFEFGEDCIQIYDKTHDEVVYDTELGKMLSQRHSKRVHITDTVSKLSEFSVETKRCSTLS